MATTDLPVSTFSSISPSLSASTATLTSSSPLVVEETLPKLKAKSKVSFHLPSSPREKKQQTTKKNWEDYAISCIESKFWNWRTCLHFYGFRSKYIESSLKGQLQLLKQLSLSDLLPDEFVSAIESMKASLSNYTPLRTLIKKIRPATSKRKKMQYKVLVQPSITPLGGGHFGFVFPYLEYKKTDPSGDRKPIATVLKLQRWENVKEPLDIHSFLTEILIGIMIQSRGLDATARIVDVVRTQQVGDVGVVFEFLPTNVAYFFAKGMGSIDYLAGLKVLMDLADKMYQLQKYFHFRHRDFRMKNVMLTCSPKHFPTDSCVRIIDLGKASITFSNKLFSAYYGFAYCNVRSDFDMGFSCTRRFIFIKLKRLVNLKCMVQSYLLYYKVYVLKAYSKGKTNIKIICLL